MKMEEYMKAETEGLSDYRLTILTSDSEEKLNKINVTTLSNLD